MLPPTPHATPHATPPAPPTPGRGPAVGPSAIGALASASTDPQAAGDPLEIEALAAALDALGRDLQTSGRVSRARAMRTSSDLD